MDFHRKHCNKVKKQLLEKCSKEFDNCNLLDLCSGRGGDIFKWNSVGIKKVIGIDNHKDSVKEAINRYKKAKNIKTKISFYEDDVSCVDFNKYVKSKQHIVSCQFALHYFEDLELFLTKVSDILVDGGYFIGVSTDGDIIKNCLEQDIKIDNVVMKSLNDSKYLFKMIPDSSSADDYFTYRFSETDSEEYFVMKENLITLSQKVGLELIKEQSDPGDRATKSDRTLIYQSTPQKCCIGNLKHNWGGNHISEMYFSFIFKKVSN